MDKTTKQANVDNFLEDYKSRTLQAWANGNKLGTAIMASLYGMWTNACRRPYVNPFSKDDVFLYRWFSNGYDDFTAAIKISADVRQKQLEAEEAADAKRAETKKPKSAPVHELPPSVKDKEEKSGFWSKKLW